ncbi:MAG TPA: rhamnan synthesis F family protein [Usitatibacter sp.]|nr:rhamnan synthesis F family protein [Usitatibacter sp.]
MPVEAGSRVWAICPLSPGADAQRTGAMLDTHLWHARSASAQLVAGDVPPLEAGVYRFELDLLAVSARGKPRLTLEHADGSEEIVGLRRDDAAPLRHAALVKLRGALRGVRVQPCESAGDFLCTDLRIRRLSSGGAAPTRELRVAAIVHLFYEDLWPEMAEHLRRIPRLDRLYVSVASTAGAIVDTVRAEFPRSLVRRVPNRGRDVLPFMQWIEVADLENIDLVCKLHTKRSPHLPTGEGWRRNMMSKLLPDAAQVQGVIRRFTAEPRLGLLGPGGYVVPSSFFWARNAALVAELAAKLDCTLPETGFRYVAGSMFWARLEALLPLRRLALCDDDFGAEAGIDDGTLAHGLERCFGLAPGLAGLELAEMPNADGVTVRDFAV